MNYAKVVPKERPTHVRWHMMGMLVILPILTYMDRLNMKIAGKYIQDEFGFSTQTMGWILSAFLFGYALCQVPGGWASDRFGPRNVLTAAILWWSLLTAAMAFAPRLALVRWFGVAWSFSLLRFLIGVGEAPSSPSYTKVVASWIGTRRRGMGSSFSILGIGLGGALTPLLVAWIMQHWGWRAAFFWPGILGVPVAMGWYLYATNQPEEHPGVNAAELELIHSGGDGNVAHGESRFTKRTPWGKMLSSASVWGLILGYFCQGFPIYFFHTWFYIYLVRVRGLTVMHGGMGDSIPYVAIALLAPLGGWFSDFAVARLGKRRGRQTAVWLGMSASAALLLIGSGIQNIVLSIVLLALGAGFNMFAAATFWATCIDLSERYSGSLSGLMNTFGNLGGWLSPIATAYVAIQFGWMRALDLAAVVTLASGFLYFFVDADKSLEEGPR